MYIIYVYIFPDFTDNCFGKWIGHADVPLEQWNSPPFCDVWLCYRVHKVLLINSFKQWTLKKWMVR